MKSPLLMKYSVLLGCIFIHVNLHAQIFAVGNVNGSGAGSQEVIEMRLRAFRKPGQAADGSQEIYLGCTDVGTASNRISAASANVNWGSSTNGEWNFSLAYSASANTLNYILSKTSGGPITIPANTTNYSGFATGAPGKSMTAINNLNYMKLRLRNAANTSSTTLSNLRLNGSPLTAMSFVANTNSADQYYNITSFNFASDWTLTGTLTFAGVGTGSYTTSQEGNSFSIRVGYSVIPIPLQWGTISLQANNNSKTLYWETLQEQHVKHFEIEGSNDGTSFTKIATQQAVGNSVLKQIYKVVLPATFKYYRIKQVDNDNSFAYSEILRNNFSITTTKPALTSNVVKNNILSLQSPEQMNTVVIMNTIGKTILVTNTTGTNFNIVLPNNTTKGYYIARVIPNSNIGNATSLPFIIE
jgi:hypothetical protein